jgi:DNA-binding CsgD family transcriptional regulator/tetratricopeptide (TPR) repeat protein
LLAHECAGDAAQYERLYADAAQHYLDALRMQTVIPQDDVRISEKLAYALSLGGDPDAANPWFDRALKAYLADPVQTAKAVEILLQRARQLWIDARTESALPLLKQAIELAERDGDVRLRKMTNSRMANYLIGLGRFNEARSFLHAVGDVDENDDAATRSTYYRQRALLAAELGDADIAYAYFERAASSAKEDVDVVNIVDVWGVYGSCADALGNTELSKTCAERSLLVSRQYHIIWSIPLRCLGYSGLLFNIGQYGRAYEYLLDALSYDAHTPLMDLAFANAGISIALHMKDETTLAKCVRPAAVDFAFRSGQPIAIANVSAAFAQWHVAHGREREAALLLHRAVDRLDYWNGSWDFPNAVARYGLPADISRVRNLVEERTRIPNAKVFRAILALFDAFVAWRQGDDAKMHTDAEDAAARFMALGWHAYVDLARTLLPVEIKMKRISVIGDKPFTDVQTALTMREQQIAELVLRGLTNRSIAVELSITENTVEKHMTSIMNRLGIRSRHQLADAVEG